ncbi:MAG: hypothetical protein L0Z50_02720, partial [Verrucomicrobiales bacterium]|nr:hypothetical protein [Verrucomicrobiales bacterium]
MRDGTLKGATIMQQWAWVIIALLLSASAVSGAESFLEKRVRRFIIHGKHPERSVGHEWAPGLPEAFRNLARHAGVPIGIEALPSEMAGKVVAIEIDARDKTVGEILEQMVWQDRRYIYRERLGVIEVLPAQAELDTAN